jgi:hypothetical protein
MRVLRRSYCEENIFVFVIDGGFIVQRICAVGIA